MNFRLWLEGVDSKDRIRERITTHGIVVRRGNKPKKPGLPYASDPGDFGRGIYYTTSLSRAKVYGPVERRLLKLTNPIILTVKEAYESADAYQTVRLSDETQAELFQRHGRGKWMGAANKQMLENAQKLTDDMVAAGHDGMVVIHDKRGELEIVVYITT